jgi:hypothetical protein
MACGCCSRGGGDAPKHDPVFAVDGSRKCTDVLCLLLFVAFWAGMFVIAGIGFAHVR